MNAEALLKSQGWRGLGHSLHHSDDAIGLKRPILFSQKQNVLGVGTNTHRTSDQWWMNAFDQQLKGMETVEGGTGVIQKVKGGDLNKIQGKHTKYGAIGGGGLYSEFVSGGVLQGTIMVDNSNSSSSNSEEDEEEINEQEKETTPATSEESEEVKSQAINFKKESKEERRARKEAKKRRKEKRAMRRAEKTARKSSKPESEKSIKAGNRKGRRKSEQQNSEQSNEERRQRKEWRLQHAKEKTN